MSASRAAVLICDGCKRRYAADGRYASAVSLRTEAYVDGWKSPSVQWGETIKDYCPTCVP